MPQDYSGVLAVAQVIIAMNIAYLGLDKFRYKKEIQDLFQQARSLISGMPEEFQEDRAWQDIVGIASGNNSRSWGAERSAGFLYCHLFGLGIDRWLCVFFVISAICLLITNAYDSLIVQTSITTWISVQFSVNLISIRVMIFIYLIIGLLAPPFFWSLGRYSMGRAQIVIVENLRHLGKRQKEGEMDLEVENMLKQIINHS